MHLIGNTLLNAHQGKLWIGTGIDTKLKVAGAQAHHGASLASQDWRGEQCVGQTGPRGHGDQVRSCPFLSIQSVYKSSKLLCVHLLETENLKKKCFNFQFHCFTGIWGKIKWEFPTSSPKLITSTFTFSFFKRFANLTSCRFDMLGQKPGDVDDVVHSVKHSHDKPFPACSI